MDNDRPVFIRPSRDADVEAMLAIYRRHIRQGVEEGVDDSATPQLSDLHDRRKNLRNRRFPHLVAIARGDVVGYAYVVLFRKRPAYRYSVKHSIYVHHEHLGVGVGGLLMQGLIDACAAAGFRQMIGYVDADNAASLGLHEKFGLRTRRPVAGRRLPPRSLGRQRHGPALPGRGRDHARAAGVLLQPLNGRAPRISAKRPGRMPAAE